MIQNQVINKIIKDKDSSLILLNNLTDEFFCDYTKEFNFIKEHLDKYGNIPDIYTFLEKFPEFDVVEVNETSRYLIDRLYEDKNKRSIASTFNKVRELLIKNKVDEAMRLYVSATDNVLTSNSIQCVDIVHDISRYDKYVEKCNDYNKYYIKTGFKELDELIGGWDTQEELATIVARSGVGKCLAKGTEVLMADGTIKRVEDVRVGDKVQSLNRVNTVLALHNGTSHGYKIVPTKGEPFTISENHILTLMRRKQRWDNQIRQYVGDGYELVDMMIEDYLALSQHQKSLYELYRPSIDYEERNVKIPPYILGLWLGDGNCRDFTLTSQDETIMNEWKDYAKSIGANCSVFKSKSKAFSLRIHYGCGRKNHADALLREYGLANNKHIPLEYMTNSREVRLQLLAGLVDSDGYYNHNSYAITQKSVVLAKQIAQLCRGLGFITSVTQKYNKKYKRFYHIVTFSRNLTNVPVRLSYKRALSDGRKNRLYNLCGFSVESVESVEYYGFMCDGDQRYLLSDNILTHNTWIMLKSAVAALEQGLTVGIYSGEMSETKVGYRIDTLLGHFSNGAIIHGKEEIQNEYKKYLENLRKNYKGTIKVLTPAMINGAAGVTALRAFVEKEKLDVLFIDQHSLLEDDRHGKSPTEKASNISRDLKNLQVLKKIPIIAVSQQNREKNEDGATLANIAMADRIGQDSTVVVFLEQKDGVMSLNLVKSRDTASGKKLQYNVDLNRGIFEYIPTESDGLDGKSCEDLRKEFEGEDEEMPF